MTTLSTASMASVQSIPLPLFPERLSADAKDLRRIGLVAARVAERRGDIAPLHLVERRTPRERVARLECRRVEDLHRQMIQCDIAAVGGLERALHRVAQLADVAGPRVIAQRSDHVARQRRWRPAHGGGRATNE